MSYHGVGQPTDYSRMLELQPNADDPGEDSSEDEGRSRTFMVGGILLAVVLVGAVAYSTRKRRGRR